MKTEKIKKCKHTKLNRCSTFSPLRTPPFFRPLTISSIITPKLKTSNFIESFPCLAYSGAMYPLHVNKSRLNYVQTLPVIWTIVHAPRLY